jgi:hypothetical protein
MTGTGAEPPGLTGVLRLTWVTGHLEHVIQHSQTDESSGTWTGLACPDQGLPVGADVDNTALRHLGQADIADLIWEAPEEFSARHNELCRAAVHAYQSGEHESGEQLWQQAQGLWTRAWSANRQAIALMQQAGITRFSPSKPQRWVTASFEHHCGPHGLARPHIHNIVITALTTGPEPT